MNVYASAKHKVLALPWRNDVATLLPKAVRTNVKGQDTLILPHTLDSTRVLKNLGIAAPSPLLTQYDWAGVKPFQAQIATAALLTENYEAFVLNEMATGKTLAALFAFDYLRSQNLANRMLVVAPLSTLSLTWQTEINTRMPHLHAEILHGSKVQVETKLKHFYADIGIINHDALTHRLAALLAQQWDVLLFDELTAFKNARTERSKAAQELARHAKYKWGMTGTPTPQGPGDAHGQVRLIRPAAMKMSLKRWLDTTTHQVSTFKRVPRKDATDTVHSVMQPAVRFQRKDVVELPPRIDLWRRCTMSSQQKAVFDKLSKHLYAAVGGGEVTVANAGAKQMKLLQVCSGFIYLDPDSPVPMAVLNPKSRIDEVLQLITEANAKFIVFSPFVAGVELIGKAVTAAGYNAPMIYGKVAPGARQKAFRAFKTDPKVHGLVAHPKTMSHGLNLTEADLIVWSSPPPGLEVYDQANARITRPGQTQTQMIAHVSGNWIEDAAYARLKTRQSMQNLLLELFK